MTEESAALDAKVGKKLLSLARESICSTLKTGKRISVSPAEEPILTKKMGVFVTLHKKGDLRGCVGFIEPVLPLQEAVIQSARNAAFHDSRFAPVSQQEMVDIEIEVSCLTEPRPVPSVKEIQLGRHGIVLEKGFARAVFLPCVAVEQGWDLTTTLDHLAMKAGLYPDEWRQGCRFEVFEAIVFRENDDLKRQ